MDGGRQPGDRRGPPQWHRDERFPAGQWRGVCVRRGTGAGDTGIGSGRAFEFERWRTGGGSRIGDYLLNDRGELEGKPESLLLKLARRSVLLDEIEQEWDAQIQKVREVGIEPTHLDGHRHVQMLPGLFEIALRLAKRHGIAAVRISHEESSLRAALSSGAKQKGTVVMRQGVQARGLKFLARDAREQAERAGIAAADYFCGIAQTGELTREGVLRLLEILAGGHDRVDVPPGLCRRGSGQIGDAAAGFAAD